MMLLPEQVFKDQPITVPASMIHAIWTYISSKPSAETAWLVVPYQQIVGGQMKALEDAANANSTSAEATETPATTA
jgi:hypothetical protein